MERSEPPAAKVLYWTLVLYATKHLQPSTVQARTLIGVIRPRSRSSRRVDFECEPNHRSVGDAKTAFTFPNFASRLTRRSYKAEGGRGQRACKKTVN